MEGLIYTAIFGNYDTPKPILKKEKGVDYVMYTDGPGAKGWEVSPMAVKNKSARYFARMVKVLQPTYHSTKDYDWFLWVDGTMQIKGPVAKRAESWLELDDFAAWKHPWWDCSYTEVEKCIQLKKDSRDNLDRSRELLRRKKFPRHYGQLATWALLRKDTGEVRDHANAWWDDMTAYTLRDQVTFMLNLWKLDQSIKWMDGTALKNPWLKFHVGHKKR